MRRTKQSLQTVYEAGMEAFARSQADSSYPAKNPYFPPSKFHDFWQRGYQAAADAYARELLFEDLHKLTERVQSVEEILDGRVPPRKFTDQLLMLAAEVKHQAEAFTKAYNEAMKVGMKREAPGRELASFIRFCGEQQTEITNLRQRVTILADQQSALGREARDLRVKLNSPLKRNEHVTKMVGKYEERAQASESYLRQIRKAFHDAVGVVRRADETDAEMDIRAAREVAQIRQAFAEFRAEHENCYSFMGELAKTAAEEVPEGADRDGD